MIYRYLSHVITEGIPVYGRERSLCIARTRAIAAGDTANRCDFMLESHSGTHVDAPNHFFESGKKISEYPPESWVFRAPRAVRVSLKPAEILLPGKWIEEIGMSCDMLLLKSAWTESRSDESYLSNGPGLHPDIALRLRMERPNIRAVGIDWLSISSFRNRPLGREAHRAFLDPVGEGHPILLVEDMDLTPDLASLKEVIILPIRVEGSDSAPCTAIGGFDD